MESSIIIWKEMIILYMGIITYMILFLVGILVLHVVLIFATTTFADNKWSIFST
jgi:hypothetical protein